MTTVSKRDPQQILATLLDAAKKAGADAAEVEDKEEEGGERIDAKMRTDPRHAERQRSR